MSLFAAFAAPAAVSYGRVSAGAPSLWRATPHR